MSYLCSVKGKEIKIYGRCSIKNADYRRSADNAVCKSYGMDY